jgi:hypothetical protein
MKGLINQFREDFINALLNILWTQWTSLGIRGSLTKDSVVGVIDPEALLLISGSVARYDARLFDAVLEWLNINGRFVNVTRFNRMLTKDGFVGKKVLTAMMDTAFTSEHKGKWLRLNRQKKNENGSNEMLFFQKTGQPIPVLHNPDSCFIKYGFVRERFYKRNIAGVFSPARTENLLLRLRAVFGLNARSEIVLYLLLNRRGSPGAIARDCYYFPATISKALAEMELSGLVISRIEGRHRYYEFKSQEMWRRMFLEKNDTPGWIIWSRLFSALEHIFVFLNTSNITDKTDIELASSLRRILKKPVISLLENCGLPFLFGNDSDFPGEKIIPVFIERLREILRELDG